MKFTGIEHSLLQERVALLLGSFATIAACAA